MKNRNILISGAGIAGTTLAYWLSKFGFQPTLLEHAPTLRQGGYAIDFWGAGFDVAERMGILPGLKLADLNITELEIVDKNDKHKSSLSYAKIVETLNGRAFTLLRSDLAKVIYSHLPSSIETIFGNSITEIRQSQENVSITFQDGTSRYFDLLIGADGLHSNVRHLTFGPESQFEKFYNYYTSSYTIPGSQRFSKEFKMYNVPGKQAAIYSTNNDQLTVFYIFTTPNKIPFHPRDIETQKQILRSQFQHIGWKCSKLLAEMDTAPDFYFDTVSQIQMEHWHRGRVALVGDACCCPSLLSGQGSTLAMVGAYILAGELKNANGNYEQAFQQYQHILLPFITQKQKLAKSFAKSFIPKSNFGIWLRNYAVALMSIPLVTKLFIKQFTDHALQMKNY